MKLSLILSAVVAGKETTRKCESEAESTICMNDCERDNVACVKECGHDTQCVSECSRSFASCADKCPCNRLVTLDVILDLKLLNVKLTLSVTVQTVVHVSTKPNTAHDSTLWFFVPTHPIKNAFILTLRQQISEHSNLQPN